MKVKLYSKSETEWNNENDYSPGTTLRQNNHKKHFKSSYL